jgi:hypothetical protein
MRKFLVLFTAFLFFVSDATHASGWLLGGGFQLGGLGRNPGPSSGCTQHTITFHTLRGGEIGGGRFGNTWMIYSGFRYGDAREVRNSNSSWSDWESISKWTTYQLLLGARVHVARTYPNPVKPCFGAALTYGWTQYGNGYRNSTYGIDESSKSGYSKGGLGALMEFGFMIDIKGPVTPFCFGQIHSFAADFGKDIYTNRDKDEPMVSYLIHTGVFVDILDR